MISYQHDGWSTHAPAKNNGLSDSQLNSGIVASLHDGILAYDKLVLSCVKYNLKRPGFSWRYPFGVVKGATPDFFSPIYLNNSPQQANYINPTAMKEVGKMLWNMKPSWLGLYLGGTWERQLSSGSEQDMRDKLIKSFKPLSDTFLVGSMTCFLDTMGDTVVGSLREYAVITLQKMGMSVGIEPEPYGTWLNRPCPPLYVESGLFRDRFARFGIKMNHPIGPKSINVAITDTVLKEDEYAYWHNDLGVNLISPVFSDNLLSKLRKDI